MRVFYLILIAIPVGIKEIIKRTFILTIFCMAYYIGRYGIDDAGKMMDKKLKQMKRDTCK